MRSAVRETPWGWMGALASDRGLRRIVLPLPSRDQVLEELGIPEGRADATLAAFLERMERYLAGEPIALDEAWDEGLGTPFQRAVWRAAQGIPRGHTRAYGEVARSLGRPRAARAVGQALANNPLPILVPCHRVVAADGSLGGFASGRGMKRRLLALEGIVIKREALQSAQERP